MDGEIRQWHDSYRRKEGTVVDVCLWTEWSLSRMNVHLSSHTPVLISSPRDTKYLRMDFQARSVSHAFPRFAGHYLDNIIGGTES